MTNSTNWNINRTRIERIWELDRRIRGRTYPNCTSFALYWAEKIGSERPVERKTIQRDIDWMRDFMHAPIGWSAREKGYYYTDDSWVFPSFRLTEGELVALLLAKQMGAMYKETPIAGEIDAFFDKIMRTMTEDVSVDPVLLGNIVSFHGHPPRMIDSSVWETIFEGLRKNRVVALEYANLNDGSISRRDVEPVHLANVEDDWFLLGFCRIKNAWRHFGLSRVKSIKLTNMTFVPKTQFNPNEYFANRFGKFIAPPNVKPYQVTIRFTKASAPYVLERIWHPAQKVRKKRNGDLHLTLPMPSLVEARRFCLAWGNSAEAIEPPELRDLMRREALALADKYLS